MNKAQTAETRQMEDEDDRWFPVVIVGGVLALVGFAVAGNILAFYAILTQTSFVAKTAAVIIFLTDALLALLIAIERMESQKWEAKCQARAEEWCQSHHPTGSI